jgi:hypothetical protein
MNTLCEFILDQAFIHYSPILWHVLDDDFKKLNLSEEQIRHIYYQLGIVFMCSEIAKSHKEQCLAYIDTIKEDTWHEYSKKVMDVLLNLQPVEKYEKVLSYMWEERPL